MSKTHFENIHDFITNSVKGDTGYIESTKSWYLNADNNAVEITPELKEAREKIADHERRIKALEEEGARITVMVETDGQDLPPSTLHRECTPPLLCHHES